MPLSTLLRCAAAAAMIAGVLRIASAFIPYVEGSLPLESLYLVIDLGLLFGLFGFYAFEYRHAGRMGFAGFVMAISGVALIVGPDGRLGEIEVYPAGALLLTIGLVLWAGGSWRTGRLPRVVPVLWVASAVVGIGGAIVGLQAVAFMIAGVLFGAAFVLGGYRLWKNPAVD